MLTRAAKAPSVLIEHPDDISEILGELTYKGFEQLKEKIVKIVGNGGNMLYFHQDNTHTYRFEKSALPNGRIYGLKEKRADESDTSKLTVSELDPIKSALEFERYVVLMGMVQYCLGSRSS